MFKAATIQINIVGNYSFKEHPLQQKEFVVRNINKNCYLKNVGPRGDRTHDLRVISTTL